MVAFRRRKVWLWRWRRNPLRRRSDSVEAWVVLIAWTVTVAGGVLAGLAATHTVARTLARERAEWRPAVARLLENAPASAADGARVWARARWTAPDGSVRTGQARVQVGSARGTPVPVWTDTAGLLVGKPPSAATAATRAALIGALTGAAAATVPLVGGRLLRGRLERRRLDRWDEDWARFGPAGGRTAG
ncbi:hypothetical protein QFZ64_001094 [Streptomyces sp. B3I8]|nr:hypothetical protein [Streptomyces sp. B3I8]